MQVFKRLLIGGIVCLALFVGVLYINSDITPKIWTPPPLPEWGQNSALSKTALIPLSAGQKGPEDITLGPDGMIYTGVESGQILRLDPATGQQSLFADTKGRPLGMQFYPDGKLIVADGIKGLLAVDPSGVIIPLVSHYQGERMKFVDDLDIAADGSIWFSDATMKYNLHDLLYDFIEMDPTGRLFRYDPVTKALTLELDNLYFANGVALGPDDSFVLVNETSSGRIMRKWLKGDQAGTIDVFLDGLPGGGDNLSFNGRDGFWVAMPSLRLPYVEALADKPFIRKLLGGLPAAWFEPGQMISQVAKIDLNGKLILSLQHPKGQADHFAYITSVNEWDGKLYLGSLTEPSVGIYKLSD